MVSAENLNDGALAVYQQMEAEKMNKTKKSLLTVLYKMKVPFIPY